MRSKDMKLGEEELVLKTNIKKENPWLYFLDKDGDFLFAGWWVDLGRIKRR
jgi:hypothetical protein